MRLRCEIMATPPYIIQALHDAVKAVCPMLDGVAIADLNDRSTWRLHFLDGATDADKTAADAAMAAFNPATAKDPIAPITKRQLLVWLLTNKKKTETDVLAMIGTIADAMARADAEIAF